MIKSIKKYMLLVVCLSIVSLQPIQPLPVKKTALCMGVLVALVTGLYSFNDYKKQAKEHNFEYSKDKNIKRSSLRGSFCGVFVGGLTYFLLSGKGNNRLSGPVDKSKPTVGLNNLGNSCFMNTALQCELNSSLVREALLSNQASGKQIDTYLRNLLEELLLTSDSSLSPGTIHTFIRNTYFSRDSLVSQQDSAELMVNIIDALSFKKHYCWNEEVTRVCSEKTCKHELQVISESYMLHLPLSAVAEDMTIKLTDCISSYYGDDITAADAKCDNCKKQGALPQKRSVKTTPARLLVQLVRFGNQKNTQGDFVATKNSSPVSFPLQAKLIPGHNVEYRLQAFHVHRGATLNSGHYTAYVKDPIKKQWYHYNDGVRKHVSDDTLQDIISTGIAPWGGTPYVLCYERL